MTRIMSALAGTFLLTLSLINTGQVLAQDEKPADDAAVEAEAGTEAGAETQAAAKPEAETGAGTESEAGAEPEAAAVAEAEAETGAGTESEASAEPDATAVAEAEAETAAGTETEAGAEAQAGTEAEAGAETQASAEAGAAKIATCVACHGQNGIGNLPENPNLAGQVPGYIQHQLQMFKDGTRENAIMAGMVATLSPQDMADLDAYYSSQPPYEGSITPDQQESALAGQKIYKAGIADYDVPACMGCHLPTGAGIAPNYPSLAGQSAEYIKTQLIAYKTGTRQHDMMNEIAFPLSAEQIDQLAVYLSGLN